MKWNIATLHLKLVPSYSTHLSTKIVLAGTTVRFSSITFVRRSVYALLTDIQFLVFVSFPVAPFLSPIWLFLSNQYLHEALLARQRKDYGWVPWFWSEPFLHLSDWSGRKLRVFSSMWRAPLLVDLLKVGTPLSLHDALLERCSTYSPSRSSRRS